MELKSTNPALSDVVFDREARNANPADRTMTLQGTVVHTGILLAILIGAGGLSGYLTWTQLELSPSARPLWLWAGLIGSMLAGLVIALITTARPRVAPTTAPLYAAAEGWAIGGVSTFFEREYAGIVVQAVALTVGVLVALLLAYLTRVIKATENLRLMVVSATGGLALVYAVTLLLRLFGLDIPYIHGFGPLGILFSLFAVAVAAFNLVLHFDFIETGVKRGAPKYMEWYAGFGLLVTLVWLYVELLHLLAKLRQRTRNS